MAEELDVALPSKDLRHCPSCGTRVASKASSCLMCGASLLEDEATDEDEPQPKRPLWIRALTVVGIALLILALVTLGLYAMLSTSAQNATPTPMPSRTPTVTPSPTATSPPTPSPSATPLPPLVHQVHPGDTLAAIAQQHGTTVDIIAATNPDIEPNNLQVGSLLLIPAGTLTPTPSPTLDPSIPTPTAGPYETHTVAQNETLSSIAEQYGVSMALIRQVNDIPIGSDTIFVGQVLVIPRGTPEPSPTPTIDYEATPTPLPAYPAPPLLSPPDGALLIGTEQPVVLQWASVGILRDGEWYKVTLTQPEGGIEPLSDRRLSTSWRIPPELMPAAGSEAEFRWSVQVVRTSRDAGGALVYLEAGDPSPVRVFTWLAPTPAPTPMSTPNP